MSVKTRAGRAKTRVGDWVAVVVPDAPKGTVSSWRRMIDRIDPHNASPDWGTTGGAFALRGPNLAAGAAYEMQTGALVIVCDRFPDRHEVQLLRAEPGGLNLVHLWSLRQRMGKAVVNYVERRLDPAALERPRPLESLPNRWDGTCGRCRTVVPAHQGVVTRRTIRSGAEVNVVMHRSGGCAPKPQVLQHNKRAGLCVACGNWVPERGGVAVLIDAPEAPRGEKYVPMHDDGCPVDGVPGPPNLYSGLCGPCGGFVHEGEGYLFELPERHVRHRVCPRETQPPIWQVRHPYLDAELEPGQVRRVTVDTGTARHPLPDDTPGRRVLESDRVEIVAVVLDSDAKRAWVRAATPQEAADVLAAELARAADVRPPDPVGWRARFCVEKIGDAKPWLAEIVGRDRAYGFDREFLRAERDYRNANSKGTRGIEYCWTLAANRVYEAQYRVSHGDLRRVYLRVTADGDIAPISIVEVETWLNTASAWTSTPPPSNASAES